MDNEKLNSQTSQLLGITTPICWVRNKIIVGKGGKIEGTIRCNQTHLLG